MILNEKEKEMRLLDNKKRSLKRWAIFIGLLAAITVISLGFTLFDRMLTGAPGGGLEINWNKVDEKVAWIGAQIRDLDATITEELGLSSTSGVLINDVEDDSPADLSGLERGDVILSVDGVQTTDTLQLQDQLQEYAPGDKLKLLVDKADGGKKVIILEVGSKDTTGTTKDSSLKKTANTADTDDATTSWGISISPLTEELQEEYNIPETEQGVVIVAVVQGSLADSQGMEVGDVIENINQVPITNIKTFYDAIDDNASVMMDIYSPDDAKRFFVTLPDDEDNPPQVLLINLEDDTPTNTRIAIPSDRPDLNGIVYARFSTSPYFIIYDLEKSEMTVIQNPYAAQVRGMGYIVSQMLIQQNISSVIVGGIGLQAFDALNLARIKVYGPFNGTVINAIKSYQVDRIPEMTAANLGGNGNSSTSQTLQTGGSPFTEETDDDEEEGGLEGAPATIPPMGKPEELELTAGVSGDARSNRSDLCICPVDGSLVTHPAGTACADMACPICGAQLMNADPGLDESGPTDLPLSTSVQLTAATGTFVSNSPIDIPPDNAVQQTAADLWYIGGQPEDVPPTTGSQQTANTTIANTTQTTLCICPLDGTQVVHPLGVSCSSLQCPICGSRLVSTLSNLVPNNVTQTANIPTAGMPTAGVPTAGTTVTYVPVAGMPTAGVPTAGTTVAYIPVAGMPTGGMPDDIGGPPSTSEAPTTDNTSLGNSGTSGGSTECICPLDGTKVVHPLGVPCSALACPICGSRMINAISSSASVSTQIIPTAGMPTAGVPTAGVPTAGTTVAYVPVAGMPTAGVPTAGVPTAGTTVAYVPVAGMPTGGMPDDIGGPVQQAYYLVPITSQPEEIPPQTQGQTTQQVAFIPVAGAPPDSMGSDDAGPAMDGTSLGGGQAGSGVAQSGRSTNCVCPMDGTTVTHPIGVPCSSLVCPICGSRLVNEDPAGATGGAVGDLTTTANIPTATTQVIQVSTISKRIVVPSTGRNLKSDIPQLFDKAPYFIFFGLGSYEVVRNPFYRDNNATGAAIAQFVVAEGGAIVICDNMSVTALKSFKDLQVKVYSGFTGSVQQAIDIYSDGRLKDSGTISGLVVDDDEDHDGGGGPPTSKSKSKEKEDETSTF